MITGETNAPNFSTHGGSGPFRAPKKRNGSARSPKFTAKPAATMPAM